jgi:hypothetical protein
MILHVLPGDAQVDEFVKTGIRGELVICREALIDGDVRAKSLDEFWRVREDYLSRTYPESGADYRETVVPQFEKLLDLPAGAEVNLWFEYELFCHVNMWFCLSLLRDSKARVFRVEPVMKRDVDPWSGFGRLSADDLNRCFAGRTMFSARDIELGGDLWYAYQIRDYARLAKLSDTESACFPYLKEACEAEIEKETRPRQVLMELQDSGFEEFGDVFAAFTERAGVYGFGDSQVKKILADI